ncbi:MAG: ABC transporter substrate-binding protein, partial [Chloroflexota bacterium]|nr:ABC transporter substrate-binding protein [Chloroflexota bacterium]
DPTKIVPDLAERWEVSPDGKVYTFYLNKKAKFHDGKPTTSADVKASFERQIWPPKGINSPRQGLYQAVEKLEASDDYTIRFTLRYPQASFPAILTIPMNWIFPKHLLDAKGDMRKDILGTGPFKLKEYVRGVAFEVVRNPDYFLPGRPYLDGIRYYIIKDYAAILAAFRTHAINMTGIYGTDVPYQKIVQREMPQAVIQKSAGMPNPYSFVPNVGRAPWSDPRVRRAVYLAIDRQASIQVLEQGDGALGSFLASGFWGIPEEELLKMPGFRQPKDQDIAEAKRLLSEAGYPQGFKTEIMTRTTKGFVDLAIFLKGEVAKIGIDATVKVVEVGVEKLRMFSKDFDVVAFRDGIPIDEPDVVFAEIYLSTSGKNWGGYKDPKIDELYLKQSQTLDSAERRRVLRQMDALLVQGTPRVNVMYGVKARFLWPEVKDFKMFGVYHNNHFRDVGLSQ